MNSDFKNKGIGFFIGIIVALTLISPLSTLAYSKIGQVIGSILYSDIITYIDGKQINSYNINGTTAITVEDLRDYGYEVVWDNDLRTLKAYYGKAPIVSDSVIKIGSTKADVLSIMGNPTSTSKNDTIDMWFYDGSNLTFKNGQVSGWGNYSKNLKVEF